ncbi:energy transducer TonB [Fulvivirga sp.]|uniref:energy transducer TonB n=1 Tax=Fulvivirga sp. TaxID=1931237 RepID=UPI0032ED648E
MKRINFRNTLLPNMYYTLRKLMCIMTIILLTSCASNVVVKSGYDEAKSLAQVDQNAEFPGGWKEFEKYFMKKMKYPFEARKNHEEGQVIVSFVVTQLGEIVNVQIVKGVSKSIDTEAIRIISKMPKWNPAMVGGENVAVQISIPMDFNLD